MVNVRLILCWCLLFFLMSGVASAKITVSVDRHVIEQGETFQLKIVSDDEPDISILQRDFTVLGTANSSKVSIINGSVSSVKELLVTLAPKSIGTMLIPAIQAGKDRSAPIRIRVKKPSIAQAAQGADIYLEAKTDVQSVYVQSQIIYTVRLYRAVDMREGSLMEPDLPDAVVERMGEDVTFQTRRNGRAYHVTERRFAVFPQKSGKFVIPPTLFQGQVFVNAGKQRSNDPFAGFFQNQRTKRVSVKSNELEIAVNPQPDNVDARTWLPARRLILSESWSPEPPKFKVGEPVTRTLRIEAEGLTAAQLPEIKPFEVNGIKQYADQPTVQTVLQGGKLIGVREEKFAIVPTQSGKLVLPELRLSWWNTEMNQQETIYIPPKIIEVAASTVSGVSTEVMPDVAAKPKEDLSTKEALLIGKEMVKTVVEAGYWPQIAVAAIVAWLITGLGWLQYWRKNRVKFNAARAKAKDNVAVSFKAANKQFREACEKNDARRANLALLQIAKALWPDSASPSLSFLSKKFGNKNFDQAVDELNAVLYASKDEPWDGKKFLAITHPCLKRAREKPKKTSSALPGLYPQHG
ncbi:MAG TPA: protein BatD [Gammaproteobacteria bacterium]|nr:protein BatD [Gammaproteobacteria bacterium]